MIQQINAASHEQAEGVGQVHTAISEIDAATQHNAALVDQTSNSALQMNQQASQLSQNMALFKTSQSPAALTAPAVVHNPQSLSKADSSSTLALAQTSAQTSIAAAKKSAAADNPADWSDF